MAGKSVPKRFEKAVQAVQDLSRLPRYEAAFIFGSVAEGTANAKSDLDVKVVLKQTNPCDNVNHPFVGNVKLDISFIGFAKFKAQTLLQIRHEDRKPNLLDALILFDKTGRLTTLQQTIQAIEPKKYTATDYQWAQFMLYHANDKVERYLSDDPAASLYSMHANIGEVLKIHYKLHGHWWVSSKRVLADLQDWDKPLAQLVKAFVSAAEINEKFQYWSAIIDHVTVPMGGRQPIEENNCDCKTCREDLGNLLAGV